MIKTVILNGSEVKISGPDGDNAEIHNFGADTVYASRFEGIAADADNVIAIPAGALDGLTGTHGTVYLLGTGKVQVNFTDEKITKTAASVQSVASGGGGVSGVSREYVDIKDSETLSAAIEHTNGKKTEIISAAKEYADSQIAEFINTAREYTESKIAEALTTVREYADGRSTEAIVTAEQYTDGKVAETLSTAEEYADGKSSEALVTAKEYADSKSAETVSAAREHTDALNADLSAYVCYTESDIFGLEADFENNKFTRLAGAVGKTAGDDFDGIRAYGGRRRCILSDSGEVLAYYGDDNFVTDGSIGQVMVEQPKFYYKVVPLKTEKIAGTEGYHLRKARYYISDTPKSGFKIHPAFVCNGKELEHIYVAAFDGALYDTSASQYMLENEQVVDWNGKDKLCSISGALAYTGTKDALIHPNVRKLAHNRGTGWEISIIQSLAATQLLFIIEYASFNSQAALGKGNARVTTLRDTLARSGATLSLGNKSGVVSTDGIDLISYRGEENIWGNALKWVDGINIHNTPPDAPPYGRTYGMVYIADHDFKDDLGTEPYVNTGISVLFGSGYTSAFGYSSDFDWLFLASEFNGNSELPVGDFFSNVYDYYYGVKWSVGSLDGVSTKNDTNSGLFGMNLGYVSNQFPAHGGARLVYRHVE